MLCDDGNFDFLYNLAKAKGHPFNDGRWRTEVLPGVEPLNLDDLDILTQISESEEHVSEYVGIERSFGEPSSSSSEKTCVGYFLDC